MIGFRYTCRVALGLVSAAMLLARLHEEVPREGPDRTRRRVLRHLRKAFMPRRAATSDPVGTTLQSQPRTGAQPGTTMNYATDAMPDSQPSGPDLSKGTAIQHLAPPLPARISAGHRYRPVRLAVAAESSANARSVQDAYVVQKDIVGVARGLTRTGIDHRAATLALSAVVSTGPQRADDPDQALRECISSANRTICTISRRDPELPDMATTLDVIFLRLRKRKAFLHFAHVGNSTIWLHRHGAANVVPLTETHAIAGGPLLRAVGLAPELTPDIGTVDIDFGDRVFVTTESIDFSLTRDAVSAVAYRYSQDPLHRCVSSMISLTPPESTQNITVVATEITDSAVFIV
jgi:hypothetical protein